MILKSLIIGVLLGAAVMLLALGLRKLLPGAIAAAALLLISLVSTVAAFVAFVPAILLLMGLGGKNGSGSGRRTSVSYIVTPLSGPLAGSANNYVLSDRKPVLEFGRENCDVLFPPDTAGVSRHHCTISLKGGLPYINDKGSQYGTYLLNPTQRLNPGSPVALSDGRQFCLARNDIVFIINKK